MMWNALKNMENYGGEFKAPEYTFWFSMIFSFNDFGFLVELSYSNMVWG